MISKLTENEANVKVLLNSLCLFKQIFRTKQN